jgi:pyruvate carboxylase
MPGSVTTIAVKVGDRVHVGAQLLALEAMKMETAITSPHNAIVREVVVHVGETVEAKDLLVVLQGVDAEG